MSDPLPSSCCTRFQQLGMDLSLVLQENDALKRQLNEIRSELDALKREHTALQEDFMHAIKCEMGEECPKTRQPVRFQKD